MYGELSALIWIFCEYAEEDAKSRRRGAKGILFKLFDVQFIKIPLKYNRSPLFLIDLSTISVAGFSRKGARPGRQDGYLPGRQVSFRQHHEECGAVVFWTVASPHPSQ